jgi:hypothetical protein|tara:strand:+ start:19 stop:840 length:822 start_codon:yes stop_codon:yes gene_type:complete
MIERELTKKELKRREEIAKELPDAEFKKRYGADWMSVKIATATNMAKKEAKDPNEYDMEGDMMKNQLRQIDSAINKLMGMVQDNDNLPEWVQSKMTKATDYIRSVRDYLEAEKAGEVLEATSHTVRYTDPKSKKRFAIPYKTHSDAENKMADLKKKGIKDVKITMDKLKPGVKFKPRMETLQSLRRRAKDLLEASYSDKSKVKDFSKEKNPVETIIKTLTKDNKVKSFINKRPKFDRVLFLDGDDLVLGDSLVMTVKDNTTLADIKKAMMKVK